MKTLSRLNNLNLFSRGINLIIKYFRIGFLEEDLGNLNNDISQEKSTEIHEKLHCNYLSKYFYFNMKAKLDSDQIMKL